MWLWRTLIYIAGIASLLFALWANILLGVALRGQWLRRDLNRPISPVHWLGLYALAAVIATLITAGLAPITFNYWHLILVFPFALFPVLLLLRLIFKVYPHSLKGAAITVLVFFVFVNIVVAHDSRKFSYDANYHQQVIDYVQKNVVPR
jgi:energy-coupling factor transporter transmembrane protein EcfT